MPQRFILLPDIRSTHNVGAFFRSADAFGVSKIFLTGITPCPPRKEIEKVALGAESAVSWEYFPNPVTFLRRQKALGVYIVCLEKNEKSTPIHQCSVPQGVDLLLVVGNEVSGVDQEVLDISDAVVHIPMQGIKESLNVSIAGSIALYHFFGRV